MTDESPFKGKTGWRRVWNAFHNTRAGLREAYLAEDAFRQEVRLAALLIPLAGWLAPDGVGLAMMIGSVLLVLIVELLNSAIEATVDRISMERHPLAKRAKDIGSAAVFIALLNVPIVWGCLLLWR
ncbi:MAG: diacylglycerol kinase [Candidatus Accumulibacter sp.]|nr:diacylglycerol kinase [Accumulibacter sp.]